MRFATLINDFRPAIGSGRWKQRCAFVRSLVPSELGKQKSQRRRWNLRSLSRISIRLPAAQAQITEIREEEGDGRSRFLGTAETAVKGDES